MAKNRRRVYGEDFNDNDTANGIPCPDCECRHSYVVRTQKIGGMVRRTRKCRHCGWTFCTIETA